MTCIFAVGSFAQSSVNEIVRAQSTGNDFNIFIDPYALELFGDSVIGSMNADSDASWNTWKDALTNGNSPGMDVNFDGNTAYGIDSLLVAGAAELDSTLQVDGYVRFSDSLYVALYAYFAANLEVAGNAEVAGSLTVTSTTSAASGSTVGNLTLADGSITDSSGAISFGDEALSTTGTAATGALTVTGTGSFSSTTSSASGSTVGNLTLADGSITDASGAISFGDENLSTTGTLTSGNATLTGTLSVAGASTLNASVDLNADLDADGTDIDLDATNDISLDAGAASNFTTSAGALTLEGAGGVTVTSTGGTFALNGAGQTLDLDAASLDIDATTVTVDATTTTFTGDVKGPKATGDDEFVTYWQLDSLANTSPYHESVMIIKKGNTAQTIIDVNGVGHDPAVSFADNPSLMFEFESDASENGDFIDYPLGPDYLQVNQTGVYTVDVSMELTTSSQGMFPVTLAVRNTDALDIASQQDVELAASTVWVSPSAAPSYWVSTTMTVIMDNVNEKLHMDLLPYGGDAEVISYKFVVSRIGAE
jgi:hypothetical protein